MNGAEGWLRAPAKVNLTLAVRGRRSDGYHELDGVMALIDLADDLALDEVAAGTASAEQRADGAPDASGLDRLERVPAGGDGWLDRVEVPLDAGNLVLTAASLYRQAAQARGVVLPALRWRLRKRVPIAAGLGGGSSDAAAALRLLALRYPAGLDLLALGERLGSDVPFFVRSVAAARARGRGERLDPVSLPAQPLVLVNPGVGVSAADAYRWWEPQRHGAPPATSAVWWAGPPLANDLEPGVAAHVPAVAATLAALRDAWDGPVAMSGSGATCFALAPDLATARATAARLRARLPATTWLAVSALAGTSQAGSSALR